MKIIVPDNYKLIVHVYQFQYKPQFFSRLPLGKQAKVITEYLKSDIELFVNGWATKKTPVVITDYEMQVLRLLRHVREGVEGIKLTPSNLEFWFDNPDNFDMVMCRVTDDGDFLDQVPGGFFTQRAAELF